MPKPSKGRPPQTSLEDQDQDHSEASHPQLSLELPSMAAILSSVRAAVREEVRVAVAAQVAGLPGLLQPPQSSFENPVAGSYDEFCRTPILVFGGQIVIIHGCLVRATLE